MKDNEKNIVTDDALDRARQMVQMLVDDEVSDELHGRLRRWFESGPENGVIEQALAELDGFEPQKNTRLTPAEREKFMQLCEKLDIRVEQATPAADAPQETEVLYHKRKISLRNIALRVAAVLLPAAIIVGAGYITGWFGAVGANADALNMISQTLDGVQKNITLQDDTQVWVNSSSKLSYPEEFTAGERRVELEGEAYFDVAKDRKRPFVVNTGKVRVKVLGTQFNIAELADQGVTEVTLHSGRVQVTAGGKSAKLDPGYKLRYSHSTGDMSIERFGDFSDWRSDIVIAENRTLPDLLRMIANYYDRQIVFDEAELNSTNRFATKFGKNNDAEQVVAALARLTGEFEYHVKDNIIYINK